MFKRITLYLLSFLALSSCTEDLCEVVSESVEDSGVFTLSAHVSDVKSNSEVYPGEDDIISLAYYVFDGETGSLERCFYTSGEAASARIRYGRKKICVIANGINRDFSGGIQTFNEAVYGYSDFSYSSRITLCGQVDLVLSESSSTVIDMPLYRMCSRVNLGSVTCNLMLGGVGKDIELKYAFLTNVLTGACPDGIIRDCISWTGKYGRRHYLSTKETIISKYQDYVSYSGGISAGRYLFRSFDSYLPDTSLSYGEKWELTDGSRISFYPFPNNTERDVNGWSNGEWIPRFTRLVVVASYNSVDYYYPVNLVGLKSNTAYTVNLVITRLGSLDPDTFDFVVSDDVTIDFGGMEDGDDIIIDF